MKEKPTGKILIRLDDELHKAFHLECIRKGTTMTAVMRLLIIKWLDKKLV